MEIEYDRETDLAEELSPLKRTWAGLLNRSQLNREQFLKILEASPRWVKKYCTREREREFLRTSYLT